MTVAGVDRSHCEGVLRNISPIPPPSIAALADIDNEVVLPSLQPILASVSLVETTKVAQELLAQEVRWSLPEIYVVRLSSVLRMLYPKYISYLSRTPHRWTIEALHNSVLSGLSGNLGPYNSPWKFSQEFVLHYLIQNHSQKAEMRRMRMEVR